MNCPSSGGVTDVLGESCFTLNNLVFAAKSSKECTPNLFWQNLSLLRNFSIGQTFTSYDRPFYLNWLKKKCTSCDRVTNIVLQNFDTWNDLVLVWKSSKECTPNHFWQLFSFLRDFSIGKSFALYDRHFCPDWKLCLFWQVGQCLRGKFLYFKQFSIGCRRFHRVHSGPFLTDFEFLRSFRIGQRFFSYDRPFHSN